ncbi:MAG: MT-A70 family methyltransferase [Betaproteobacteria bacterium]
MEQNVMQITNRQATNEAFANLEAHAEMVLIPQMTEGERADLMKDIQSFGQKENIKVFQGQIVDGRERYNACKALGITPRVEEIALPEGLSVKDVVLSFNFHRRHLTDGQKAIIAARMVTTSLGCNQSTTTGQVTQRQAADFCQTSKDSLQRAKTVLAFRNESLTQAVIEGRLDVFNAGKIAMDIANKGADLTGKTGEQLLHMAKATVLRLNTAKRNVVMAKVDELRQGNKPLLTGKKFGLFYVDPPWDYLPQDEVGYPTMSLKEICSMPVPKITEDNAVLALWVPASQLENGLEVVKAWGFEYKTCAVWDKGRPGTGVYFRSQHELLFIATRGKPTKVPVTACISSVIQEMRTPKHSKKPVAAYVALENMYAEMAKLELFARGEVRKGWEGWGNEAIPNQPEQEEVPKTLPKAKLPKVPVKGKAANDAKIPATKASAVRGAKSVPLKKAA